jgi:hypothetical protein
MTKPSQGEKGIKTVYFIRGQKSKIIWSKNANRAVTQCVGHMQIDHYGSHLAEVFDAETGELHAQVKLDKNGVLHIYLKRNARDYETKYSIAHLIAEGE